MISEKVQGVYKAYFSNEGLVKIVHMHLMKCHWATMSTDCSMQRFLTNDKDQYWACWIAQYFVDRKE